MVDRGRKDWKQLAQEAAIEQDAQKLLALVNELNAILEERENQMRTRVSVPPASFETQPVGKRLLFVDDEPSIRLTLPPALEQHGFDVRVASGLPEALEEIRTHQFDVLLSDLNLNQEGDGFTVVDAMRQAHPNCLTILLTAYPAFETAVQAIHNQVDDYFVKPADVESLVRVIEDKLRARRLRLSRG